MSAKTLQAPAFQQPRAMRSGEPRRIVLSAGFGTGYYDAANTTREADWGPLRNGVFEDFFFTGAVRNIALSRFRREVRNNPYLAGLYAKYPEAVGNTALRSRTKDKTYNLAKERAWRRRTKRTTHNGRSLRRVEKMLGGELLLAGELFFVELQSGRLQPITSEFCGSPGGTTRFGDREVNGIVYDANDTPVAYRFGRMTRWGSVEFRGTDDELVDARHVIHVFDADRVMMGRGLPWLLASMKTARDLYEITRSKTKQIKDVNAITGTIEKTGADAWLNDIADQGGDPEAEEAAPETEASPADKGTAEKKPLTITLAPGTFVALEPGEKLNTIMSEYKATDYKELIMLMLHAISSPVGLPVELWFSGLGDVNYSGFKGLGVQWKARRACICDFLVEAFHEPYHDWLMPIMHALGEVVDVETGAPVANPQRDGDESLIEWGWKRAAVLDDEKAAKSNQLRLMTGEGDLAQIWAENGEFPEEVFARRRQLYIAAMIAAGELEAGQDHADVKVPLGFLLRGELKGTTVYPFLPDGTGTGEDGQGKAGAPAAGAGQDPAEKPPATEDEPDPEDPNEDTPEDEDSD